MLERLITGNHTDFSHDISVSNTPAKVLSRLISHDAITDFVIAVIFPAFISNKHLAVKEAVFLHALRYLCIQSPVWPKHLPVRILIIDHFILPRVDKRAFEIDLF